MGAKTSCDKTLFAAGANAVKLLALSRFKKVTQIVPRSPIETEAMTTLISPQCSLNWKILDLNFFQIYELRLGYGGAAFD